MENKTKKIAVVIAAVAILVMGLVYLINALKKEKIENIPSQQTVQDNVQQDNEKAAYAYNGKESLKQLKGEITKLAANSIGVKGETGEKNFSMDGATPVTQLLNGEQKIGGFLSQLKPGIQVTVFYDPNNVAKEIMLEINAE
jgi:hypothetical protein